MSTYRKLTAQLAVEAIADALPGVYDHAVVHAVAVEAQRAGVAERYLELLPAGADCVGSDGRPCSAAYACPSCIHDTLELAGLGQVQL